MSARRPRPLLREPLVVALVLTNLGLGGLLLYKSSRAPAGALPPGHPDVSAPGAADESLPPGHPDVSGAMGGGSAMSPELAAVAAAARGGSASAGAFALAGTVKLSPRLKEPWPKGAPVFVVARAASGGPPFAARRYDGVKAPFAYALGPADVMFAGTAAPRSLVVTVRVDQDGDAMTRQLGDLEGGPSKAVGPKGTVDVTVDRPAALTP